MLLLTAGRDAEVRGRRQQQQLRVLRRPGVERQGEQLQAGSVALRFA
jgi:hypothetical protein